MIWKPNTTVAAVVEQDGKFLLVEEETADGIRLNQPAGHLENNETLLQAVIRETGEETAYRFQPEALLGVYHWKHPVKDLTYLRFAFIGSVSDHRPEQRHWVKRAVERAFPLERGERRPVRCRRCVLFLHGF